MVKRTIVRFSILFFIFVLLGGWHADAVYKPQQAQESFLTDRVIFKLKKGFVARQAGARALRMQRTYVLSVPQSKISQYVQLLSKDPSVEYVEPDYKVSVLETTDDPSIVNSTQWGMYKIMAAANGISAWDTAKSNNAVKIAILDTGIDQNHEDVSSKIVLQHNCTDSATVDDLYGHGTHVAGIAAASTNNGLGVAGTGYNASLMNAKALADDGSGYHSWIAECITWATDSGADVINLSLGGASSSNTLQNAIAYAWNNGVVVACAAGNSGDTRRQYPGWYSQCIAVAATDSNDQKASFSTYGQSWVDVAAPGVNIYSTVPNHTNKLGSLNYANLSGTSMATPHVAGLAGLLFGINGLNNQQVRNFIEQHADKIAGTGNYWKWGRMNALNAVNAALNTPESTPTPTAVPQTTPTPTPTVRPSPTPTPTLSPTPTLGAKPWYCAYWPTLKQCQ